MEGKSKNDYSALIWFTVVSLIAFVIWANAANIAKKVFDNCPTCAEQDLNFGEIGDMFGAVNAIFSGLAFAGIIITILLQRKELQAQREELTATRTEFEIARITNIIYKQLELIKLTANKLTFFEEGGVKYSGIESLQSFNNNINDRIRQARGIEALFMIKADRDNLIQHLNHRRPAALELIESILNTQSIIKALMGTTKIDEKERAKLEVIFSKNIDPEIFSMAKLYQRLYEEFISIGYNGDDNKTRQGHYMDMAEKSKKLMNIIT